MATPAETVDNIIANAIELADDHVALMEHYSNFGVDIATGGAPTVINPYPWAAALEAVEPDIPTVDDPTTVYETYRDDLIGLLSGQLADFFVTYYPIANDAYDDATSWLIDTITNGGTGIPQDVEDQIWQRGRNKIINEGKRAEDQLVAGFAAKGFTLPPGVMAKGIKEIRFAQLSALGTQATDIAVKQIEIEIDNIKFAVEKALDMRIKAIQAAADYIRALAIAPELGVKLSETDASVQAKMMSATADLYRARLSRDELVMNTEIARMSNFQSDQKIFYDTYVSRVHESVQGVLKAADGFSRTAQAALSSLNSVASIASSSFA